MSFISRQDTSTLACIFPSCIIFLVLFLFEEKCLHLKYWIIGVIQPMSSTSLSMTLRLGELMFQVYCLVILWFICVDELRYEMCLRILFSRNICYFKKVKIPSEILKLMPLFYHMCFFCLVLASDFISH